MSESPPATALVVEGGGLRTIFAAGLLDGFLAANFDPFELHVGVSAGSGALAGFLARMPGRTQRVMADYSLRPGFVSWRRFLRGGHMVDLDWLWAVTVAELPLDLGVLFGPAGKAFVVVLTDAVTGQAVYARATPDNVLDVLKASNALPFLYRGFPRVDGRPMSDGGAADALPVAWTLAQGVRRLLVVRSRPRGYRRRTSRTEDLAVRATLWQYPALVEALATRAPRYNATLELIRQPPPGVDILEICPPDDFRVERLGQNAASLQHGYDAGRAMAPEVIARWRALSTPPGRTSRMNAAPGTRLAMACTMALTILAGSPVGAAVAARAASTAPSSTSAVAPASASATTPAAPTAPRRVDAETAVSPVYPYTAKPCRNHDSEGSEGEDFLRQCPGYGGYALRASGSDYRVNYGIQATAPGQDFTVMLFPLDDGPAGKYARADLFDEQLSGPVEWRLDAQGRPYAVVVRAAFYKNIGSAKTFRNPRNKAAEFLLVRGLAGFDKLQVDVPTTGTAFDPLAQARTIAREFLDQGRH